ncbi:MAG: phytanoyl-CoA dioxygenase family protein [Planctomycetota bacterium]|nr:phytanoyl-CoA dioxygenase family protein [Planctomycetota bacterium]
MSMPSVLPASMLDLHQLRLESAGYTLIENALSPAKVADLLRRIEALLPIHGEVPTAARPDTPSRDINRVWEHDAAFEELMDLPGVFEVAERYMGGDITLLATAIANIMPKRTPARVPWHLDGPYVRLTYYLTDVAAQGGPTGVLPGTHRAASGPPKWFNTEDGYPRGVAGMTPVIVKAGTCMVNDTLIWHTSTPNDSDVDRKLIWIVFKKAAQELTPFLNLRNSEEFVARQKSAVRRRLCGVKG